MFKCNFVTWDDDASLKNHRLPTETPKLSHRKIPFDFFGQGAPRNSLKHHGYCHCPWFPPRTWGQDLITEDTTYFKRRTWMNSSWNWPERPFPWGLSIYYWKVQWKLLKGEKKSIAWPSHRGEITEKNYQDCKISSVCEKVVCLCGEISRCLIGPEAHWIWGNKCPKIRLRENHRQGDGKAVREV